jgi:hypothetical protein
MDLLRMDGRRYLDEDGLFEDGFDEDGFDENGFDEDGFVEDGWTTISLTIKALTRTKNLARMRRTKGIGGKDGGNELGANELGEARKLSTVVAGANCWKCGSRPGLFFFEVLERS